uniref:Uncharacterized protein n=1 Tax=Anguilla anguilla TaxID=7936 RepID=A0A0E9VH56_ANGAN
MRRKTNDHQNTIIVQLRYLFKLIAAWCIEQTVQKSLPVEDSNGQLQLWIL